MIRIHTLGGLSVRDSDGKLLTGAATQPRRLAILALLARAGDRGVSRERILSLLWPDADDERGPRALAQALYALRKDLSTEDSIGGAKELRFDPALVSSDVGEFSAAVSRGDDARAATLYHGPFLDGFHLPGADEFSRWAERERLSLAHENLRSLESLARGALARGDVPEALTWWRKVTALEPLNARFTMGLMEALVAAGDRAGAIKQAHVYQLLVEQELDLPPDKEVMALAERLRTSADSPSLPTARVPSNHTVTPTARVPSPAKAIEHAETVADAPTDTAPLPRRSSFMRNVLAGVAVVAAAISIAAAMRAVVRARGPQPVDSVSQGGTTTTGPVVAIGQIMSYGTDSAAKALAGPVSDLLATSLARVPGLRVVSRGRLLELMRPAPGGGAGDTSAGGFVTAARRAGGTEIVDGTVYTRPDGRLRLDLRRVDLSTGAIGGVHTVEGSDLFALVDSGTAHLVAALGTRVPPPAGSVADVTTRSVTAYRMYERGIRAYFRGDSRTALALFDGALAEDSMFALATYYAALAAVPSKPESVMVLLRRATRLASRAPDRERLTILAGWSYAVSSPALQQIAETLVTRYPTEVEGYLYTGIARVFGGEFLAGIAPLERVVIMDSLGPRGVGPSCHSCEAYRWLVSAYQLADSFPAAERVARRWLQLQPGTVFATTALTEVLEAEGRAAAADSTFHSAIPADPAYDDVLPFRAMHLIRAGDYGSADRLLLAETKQGGAGRQLEAYWQLAISLREQGRLAEALDAARRMRPLAQAVVHPGSKTNSVLEAQLQLEAQRPAIAAALFDSIAKQVPTDLKSQSARGSAWVLTHAADAHAAAGDTAILARLADTVQALGNESGYGRDRRLYHHVRGLLLAARGDDDAAIGEFRSAIYSLPGGYTRTNYELARLLLHRQRPREAIAVLQPALRGPLEASNLYVNRIELHELLGQAWESARGKDSAAAHYGVVARVWAAGDPPFRARADRARLAARR